MKLRARTLTVLAALTVIVVGGIALAAGRPGGPAPGGPHGPGMFPLRALQALTGDESLQTKLGLDQTQIARLKAIASRALPEIGQLRGDLSARRMEVASLLKDPSADRKTIEAKIDSLRSAREAAARTVATTLLDMRDVLTPDQRTQLRSMAREKAGSRMHGGPHRGQGHDCPSSGETDGPDDQGLE
jgi:Spy/CpxP family protein refolding chaperone